MDVKANAPVSSISIEKNGIKEQKQICQKRVCEFYQRIQKRMSLDREDKIEKLGYMDLMSKTLNLMMEQQTRLQILNNPPDLLIEISRDTCGTYDFYRAAELIETGRQAYLQKISK